MEHPKITPPQDRLLPLFVQAETVEVEAEADDLRLHHDDPDRHPQDAPAAHHEDAVDQQAKAHRWKKWM